MKKLSTVISAFLLVMIISQGLAFAGAGKMKTGCKCNFTPGNIKHHKK